MVENKITDKKYKVWNRVLIALLSILLVLTSFVYVLRDNFISGSKAYVFLRGAKTFDNLSNLTKEVVRENLPDKVKGNFIEKAIIEKIMDIVITPQNISKVAEPGLKTFYDLSAKGANLAERGIGFNTTKIKSQAQKYVPSLGLPQAFTDASDTFVSSVPDDITILDPKKNPNSPLAVFVKLRDAYRDLKSIADILSVLIGVSLVGLILVNIKNLKRLSSSLAWSFGIAAATALIINLLLPPILSLVLGNGGSVREQSINQLVNDLVYHFLELQRSYIWLFALIAGLSYILHFILTSDKTRPILSSLKSRFIKK